jgi:hypothetical protein
MKKLTIIIAMLMATSAWAETKSLECTGSKISGEKTFTKTFFYTFDPEESLAEYTFTEYPNTTTPMKVIAFPSYYRLTYIAINPFSVGVPGFPKGGKITSEFLIDISRVDLSFTHTETSIEGREMGIPDSTNVHRGLCKFLEIEETKKLF